MKAYKRKYDYIPILFLLDLHAIHQYSTYMWKCYFIVMGLYCTGLAHADDHVPTAENWEELNPKRCEPDPGDNLSLTPVIFPPVFETYTETWTGHDTPHFAVRNQLDENRNSLGPRLIKRFIPDVSHPRQRRRMKHQYVAFLNTDNKLVDEIGQPISENNPIEFTNSDLIEGYSGPYRQTLWERFDPPPDSKSPSSLSTYKGLCEYFMEQRVYRQKTLRVRTVASQTGFVCKPFGGYEIKAPIISEKLIRESIVYRPNTITFWDEQGARYSGPSAEVMDRFNALADSNKCQWKKAEITP